MTLEQGKWKKAVIGALLGVLLGFGAMTAFFEWGGGAELEVLGGERIAAAAVGIVYLLTGLIVCSVWLLRTLVPRCSTFPTPMS